ncbi:MAG: TonB-dependent receptor [Candidatus Kapaibacterium sp.]
MIAVLRYAMYRFFLQTFLLALLFLCGAPPLFSQLEQSIQGKMVDSATEEPIAGGVIRIESVSRVVSTDERGAFQIENLPPGRYNVTAEALGYQTTSLSCTLQMGERVTLTFQMVEEPLLMPEIVMQAERISGKNSVSTFVLDAPALRSGQGLVEDPIKTLTTLPGISGGIDLFSPTEIYVRGGAPEENLFLLDRVKLYWPWYFGGIKSVYNNDIVERVELLTGGFPATFGNHMSSVLNVSTRSGDFNAWGGGVSIGFFNAAAHLEGPIIPEKLSVVAAIRRTYLDLFLSESAEFPVPSFGDITWKATWMPNRNNRISFSGISSDESMDFLAAEPEPGLPDRIETSGRTDAQSAEWLAVIGTDFISKFGLTHTTASSKFAIGKTLDAQIEGETFGVREEVEWNVAEGRRVEAGIEGTQSIFSLQGDFPLDPLETDPNDTTIKLRPYDLSSTNKLAGAYLLYDGRLVGDFGLNAGLRIDYHDVGEIVDISPRLSLRYTPTKRIELAAALGDYRQFPEDEALAYNPDLKSQLSRHYIASLRYRFSPTIAGWVEGYVKDYKDLTVYDTLLRYSSDGTGLSRGIELFLRNEGERIQGWISYALSSTTRQEPLQEREYPFAYDQRHIFNASLSWRAPNVEEKKWFIPSLISGQMRLASGRPYTPVLRGVQTNEGWRPVKGEINSEVDPYYLNLNLRLEWHYKLGSSVRAASFFEAWNLTNRKNVLGRSYRYGSEFENNVLVQPYYTTPLLVGGGFRVEF